MIEHLHALIQAAEADPLFPVPEFAYRVTPVGFLILGMLGLVTKIILARITQTTELAKLAVEQQDEMKKDLQATKSEAEQAKELSRPTGNGFSAAVMQSFNEVRRDMRENHEATLRELTELSARVDRLEKKN